MTVQTTEYAPSLRARFSGFFARLGQRFEKAMELQSRTPQIMALQSKSDEELARLGITRDQIPYYVFRDRAWL